MFQKKTIRDIDVEGRIALVRTDYNVPLSSSADNPDQLEITSDFRVRASLPTIEYLLKHGASKIILASHMGRPEGKDEKLSLRIVADCLAGLLPDHPIHFVDQCTDSEAEAAIEELPEGSIVLLENLRFDPREKANDGSFATELAEVTHADLFVLDGFGVSHRSQASTVAITKLMPAVAGLLLEKEVATLSQVAIDPDRPFVVVIGGAKVADKQPLIEHFIPLADKIIVGGKIAADGYNSDDSKIYVATDFDEDGTGAKLDIGPISTSEIITSVQSSKTILWNGVLGKVEDPAYATSSTILAKAIGENPNLTSVICGGDTTGFIENLCLEDPNLHYSLISTGGGAALELLSGKTLPGIDALMSK